MRNFILCILLFTPLYLQAGFCYSIATEVDKQTPVSPLYDALIYQAKKCTNEKPFLFDSKKTYYGCYKYKKDAKWALKHHKFPFKHPQIVYHKVRRDDTYIILPLNSRINARKQKHILKQSYKNYSLKKVLQKFPKYFYGEGIAIRPLHKITFIPTANLYSFKQQYEKIGLKDDVLILYDGSYTLEMLYKKLHSNKYIKKTGPKEYQLKIPIIIAPTASLTIQNKTVLLQTKPKAIFILYYGDLYLKNNKLYTYDTQHSCYAKRQHLSEKKLLYFNAEDPRPYITGFRGSHTYMINNIFKGLGFHSSVATFGLSIVDFLNNEAYYLLSYAFFHFVRNTLAHPEGIYLGNDISDASMAFYTNQAHKSIYMGNYTHDNIIYNFDPHDYSQKLLIARNLSTRAKHAHGIIISRGVEHSIIAENLVIRNHAAGIMLDRLSNHNFIYKNISLLNGYMGISIQESKDILINKNLTAFNFIDGIMIRNSLSITVQENKIFKNSKNGIELISKNIDATITRDMLRDPYPKASSAVIKKNILNENYNSNIMVKNSAAIFLNKNKNTAFKTLGGDLEFFYENIVNNHGKFRLYGRGFPFHALSIDRLHLNPIAFNVAKNIYIELSQIPNQSSSVDLGIAYLAQNKDILSKLELQRAASLLSSDALKYLAYITLVDAGKQNFQNKDQIVSSLSYLMEYAILSNLKYIHFEKLLYFIPHSKLLINKAFQVAVSRMKKGRLFKDEAYNRSIFCRETLKDQREIQAALKVFLYKMKSVHTKDILNYEKVLNQNFTIFDKSTILSIKQRFNTHNYLQDRAYYKIHTQLSQQAKSRLCQKSIQKHAYIQEQSHTLIDQEYKKEIKKMQPQLQHYLDNINLYRTRKITMKQLLKIIYNEEN